MNGAIAWFTRNHVAANLLLVLILFSGLYSLTQRIPLEVFPSFERDIVNVNVSLSGSTPQEVEEGLAIRVEEAISDLEGIKAISSVSQEGATRVSAEIDPNYNTRELMNDIKSRVDAINTFPDDAERPVVSISQRKRETISVALYGNLSQLELKLLGEQVRDEIQALPNITQVDLESVVPYEISIEVSEKTLREYGLTLEEVAKAVNSNSVDLTGGTLKTPSGEILLRAKGQAYLGSQFADLIVLSRSDGTHIRLGDIANVNDGFEDSPIKTRFNQQPAVMIEVYRVGNQNAIDISDSVKAYIASKSSQLPNGIHISYWRDSAKAVKARIKTLTDSALQGCLLVILLLALFLRPAIAFWVCMGIPVSILGGLMVMPYMGVTLNVFSLFAFIMVLGILVDDAIVTGENVYTHLQRGSDPLQAAIKGTQEVSVPVTFGVLTTVAAFMPLMMIEGTRGKIFAQIPMVVIPVLIISLIESKLILPAHLKHVRMRESNPNGWFSRLQHAIADGFEQLILRYYRPALEWNLHHRYISISIAAGIFIIALTLVFSGWTRFIFFPRVPSETARAVLAMPAGTPFEITDSYVDRIGNAAQRLKEKYQDKATGKSVILDIMSTSGSSGGTSSGQSNVGRVYFEIEPPETRHVDITSNQLVKEWRKLIGPLPGSESLTFKAESGSGGSPLDVQLSSHNLASMAQVAERVKKKLTQYPDVFDVEDSLSDGKQELQLQIKPQGQILGLTLSQVAQQVRHAFYGYQVQRVQRSRDDVSVYVRYPSDERQSLANLQSLLIQTPSGHQVPFSDVATITESLSPAKINRLDRMRTQNIRGDLNKETANVEAIKSDLTNFLLELGDAYPNVTISLEGEAKEQRESFGSLGLGLAFVLFVIYALLAIPFRSYWQPLVVMSVIPFGVIGAIAGHWIMGMPLTIMSLMGMLALTGVVVNDSLVLVDYINRTQAQGDTLQQAVRDAGVARFRAVLLTSLTTFAGLMPLIFDNSTQAQFMIPMAVSLGFGILFATALTLLLVPVNYMLLHDAKQFADRVNRWFKGEPWAER
jgi:multidrug efflux pump subunit AcrB